MDEDRLGLYRLRDWLTHHPGWIVVDNARRLNSDPLAGSLYHSEGIAIFFADRADTYILAPLSEREDLSRELAQLVDEESGYDLPSTDVVIELIDELIKAERE